MIRTILSDPGMALLAVLLGIVLIMLFPVIAAIRRRAAENRAPPVRHEPGEMRAVPSRREPRIGGYSEPYDDDEADEYGTSSGRFASGPRRRKPFPIGRLVKFAWFGLGVAVGAGAMALGSGVVGPGTFMPPVGPSIAELEGDTGARRSSALADAEAIRMAEEALAGTAGMPLSPAQRSQDRLPLQEDPVQGRLDSFVTGLSPQLPLPVGGETNLIQVTAGERLLTLGFNIGQPVAESDYQRLQETLETRFRAGICGTADDLGLRVLNENGVRIHVVYTDMVGKTVARLDVPQRFCASADAGR